jgi:serine/threonine protein kinase
METHAGNQSSPDRLHDSTTAPSATQPVAGLPPELAANPQYEIMRELGRGGMGVVYLARNKLLGRLEVLKVVNKALLERPGVAERFLREIQSAARLNHPNVVTAHNAMQLGESLAFAMEYVDGEDLYKLLKARGPLRVANACHYVREAALGLQHAFEKKMVHRDIKPQNLILARDGKKHMVKVLDFGLAKVKRENENDSALTGTGMMLGTPDYMAPEQTMDAARADIRADIYSLGCTLYHLLTGKPPFKADSLYQIMYAHQNKQAEPVGTSRPDVPAELANVVAKMMAKDPAQRYQTPADVAKALVPFIKQPVKPAPGGQSQDATHAITIAQETARGITGAQETIRKPSSSTKTKWLLGAGAGCAALVGLCVALVLVGLWAGGVFKVKTPDGTIVLENLPPDADVTVDGDMVTVKASDGKLFEVRVAPGKKHRLEVKKDGFKVFGEEVEIDAGGRKSVVVRLEPVAAEKEKWVSMFNGKDLTGWDGLKDYWSVKGGVIAGHQSKENSKQTFLVWKGPTPADFELRLKYRFLSPDGNSGVQFRSKVLDDKEFKVGGYQADMDAKGGYDGSIYDEAGVAGGRGKMSDRGEKTVWDADNKRKNEPLPGGAELDKFIKVGEWNAIHLVARGNHIRYSINGHLMTELTDDSPKAVKDGVIALQLHAGYSMEVHFKDIDIKELPPARALGFVSLFNGKDLTGWKLPTGGTGDWKVVDGSIVSSGERSHLFSEGDNYENFHLYVEAMINDGGNSGVFFRTTLGTGFPKGYEAQIDATHPDTIRTGSLYPAFNVTEDDKKKIVINEMLHKPGEWFTYEMIADGNHIIIKLNGKTTVDFVDPNNTYAKGHFALQQHDAGTVVKFRKIEVKELPPSRPVPQGFVPLFNGKDLTGWHGAIPLDKRNKLSKNDLAVEQKKADEAIMPHWTVRDGMLVNDGQGDNLATVKEYGNFEMYLDWKIEPRGDSGVYLRGYPQVQIWDSDASPGAKGADKGSGSGGLWNNLDEKNGKRPLKKVDKPVGEWNTMHIVMKGERVTVWLNDVMVVDNAMLENYWDHGKALVAKGPLELQKHTGTLWFKNIYIRELPD